MTRTHAARSPEDDVITNDAGFTMLELAVTTGLMLILTAAVGTALTQLTKGDLIVWNRTEMHSSVRGATELLQQEVGQAGRITLPSTGTPITLTTVVIDGSNNVAVGVTSTAGMFAGEKLTIGTEDAQETVTIASVNSATSFTSSFKASHAIGTPVAVFGGFVTGVMPPNATNGSTGTVLKLYGDINGDSNMVYIEYTCDTANHKLYRNSMAFDAGSKPALTDAQVLLSNIVSNPGNTPCFTYQTALANGVTYVTDVAITLTVRTQRLDPITQQYQTESKALLNVSPRNVYNVWLMASMGSTARAQATPPSVTALLP